MQQQQQQQQQLLRAAVPCNLLCYLCNAHAAAQHIALVAPACLAPKGQASWSFSNAR
jgi:hypothetical protein